MKCNNCEKEGLFPYTLSVVKENHQYGDVPIALLCTTCTDGVLTLKIVLKRDSPKKDFSFDGYLPVESTK